ncbi:MAG TPA: hypothetical protein VFZ08_08035 [Terriglobia bacterium]|nr:hypothetical protein [Terriglobia bacterium]
MDFRGHNEGDPTLRTMQETLGDSQCVNQTHTGSADIDRAAGFRQEQSGVQAR